MIYVTKKEFESLVKQAKGLVCHDLNNQRFLLVEGQVIQEQYVNDEKENADINTDS